MSDGHAKAAKLLPDTRDTQIQRVALFMRLRSYKTAKELDHMADVGCIRKVLSEMKKRGYIFAYGWRFVEVNNGRGTRQVKTYRLLYSPSDQPDLFQGNEAERSLDAVN